MTGGAVHIQYSIYCIYPRGLRYSTGGSGRLDFQVLKKIYEHCNVDPPLAQATYTSTYSNASIVTKAYPFQKSYIS